ncbi:MAG: hypothetical protein AAGD07_10870 [Planctomycetota bacterium]
MKPYFRVDVGRNELFSKIEISFHLPDDDRNVFDRSQIEINARIRHADDATVPMITVPAFYFEHYEHSESRPVKYSRVEDPASPDELCWMIRTVAPVPGKYEFEVLRSIDCGEAEPIGSGSFEISPESDDSKQPKGFIRVNANNKDTRFLVRGAYIPDANVVAFEEPFVPLGHNICWGDRGGNDGPDYFRGLYNTLYENGGNWSRLWMTTYGEGPILEWAEGEHQGLGRYNMKMASQLDAIVDFAERAGSEDETGDTEGIALQLVIFQSAQFEPQSDWEGNAYNEANGGPVPQDSPPLFFGNNKAKHSVKNLLRYIVARWGYSRAILAWELFNEAGNVDKSETSVWSDDIVQWHREMAAYICETDPFDHLITTSAEGPGLDPVWECMDLAQPHIYAPNIIDEISTRIADLRRHNIPVLIGEVGADPRALGGFNDSPAGNVPEHALRAEGDPEAEQLARGLQLHNAMWCATHSGSGSMYWWWENYIDRLRLHDDYQAVHLYWEGANPIWDDLQQTQARIRNVPVQDGISLFTDFYHASNETDVFVSPEGYLRAKKENGDEAPTMVPVLIKNLLLPQSPRCFTVELATAAPMDLRFRLADFDPEHIHASLETTGERIPLTTRSRYPETVLRGQLPAGKQTLRIEYTPFCDSNDTPSLHAIDLHGFRRPAIDVVGLSSKPSHSENKGRAYLWFYRFRSQYHRNWESGALQTDPMTVSLPFPKGNYRIDQFATSVNPETGVVDPKTTLGNASVGDDRTLEFAINDFPRDIAIQVSPADDLS